MLGRDIITAALAAPSSVLQKLQKLQKRKTRRSIHDWERDEVVDWLLELKLGSKYDYLKYFLDEQESVTGELLVICTEKGNDGTWLREDVGIKNRAHVHIILEAIRTELGESRSSLYLPQNPSVAEDVAINPGSEGEPEGKHSVEEYWKCSCCARQMLAALSKCMICQFPKPVKGNMASRFKDLNYAELEQFCDTNLIDIFEVRQELQKVDSTDLGKFINIKVQLIQDMLSKYEESGDESAHSRFKELRVAREEFFKWRSDVESICSRLDEKQIPQCVSVLGIEELIEFAKTKNMPLQPMKVTIFGAVNSGKSTLTNLLFDDTDILEVRGEDNIVEGLFPSSEKAGLTTAICEVHYSEEITVLVSYSDGEIEKKAPATKLEAKQLIRQRCAEQGEHLISKVEIGWPTETLECGITLIDSPGLGEERKTDDEEQEWIQNVKDQMASSTVSIFVHGGRWDDYIKNELREIRKAQGVLFNPNAFFFVLTKVDRLRKASARRQRIKEFKSGIQDIFEGVDLSTNFIVANLQSALKVRTVGLVSPDHVQLRNGLLNWLQRVLRDRADAYYQRKVHAIEGVRSLVCMKISGMLMSKPKLKDLKRQTRKTLRQLERVIEPLDVKYDEEYKAQCQVIATELCSSFQKNRDEIVKDVTTRALSDLPENTFYWKDHVAKVCVTVLEEQIPELVGNRIRSVKGDLGSYATRLYKNVYQTTLDTFLAVLASVTVDALPVGLTAGLGLRRLWDQSPALVQLIFSVVLLAVSLVFAAVGVVLAIPAGILVGIPLAIARSMWSPAQKCSEFAKEILEETVGTEENIMRLQFFQALHGPTFENIQRYMKQIGRAVELLDKSECDVERKEIVKRDCKDAKTHIDTILDPVNKLYLQKMIVCEMPENFKEFSVKENAKLGCSEFADIECCILTMGPVEDEKQDKEVPAFAKIFRDRYHRRQVQQFEYSLKLKSNPSPNNLKHIGTVIHDGRLCIIFESFGRLLSEWLKDHKNEVDLQDIKSIGIGVARGISHLHKLKMVHRDIRPENILICEDSKEVKVADLDICPENAAHGLIGRYKKPYVDLKYVNVEYSDVRPENPARFMHQYRKAYVDPNAADEETEFSANSDIYSFGMLLWELYHLTGTDIRGARVDSYGDYERPRILRDCPVKLKKLIESCWQENHDARPSWLVILEALEDLS